MLEKSLLGQTPRGFHKIAYAEWGQATARPPVVCVHGLTRNGRDFDWLAGAMATDTRIFCPDIAGRRKSDDLPDPSFYSYAQYCADMTALIARIDAPQIDWVGTSMGGIIGMLLAAQPNTPIRRLIINDVGPFIPLDALKRIGDYVGTQIEFDDLVQLEKHMRNIYAPFGITGDEVWRQLAQNGFRKKPNGKFVLAYDPRIAQNFTSLDKDVDFWNIYDQIKCPTLVLRGELSDILSIETAEAMVQRGPRAKLATFKDVGHAPGLIDPGQINIIRDFLKN